MSATKPSVCHELHVWLHSLPRYRFPFLRTALPANGVYVIFEAGEYGHGGDRIVRVGTHTGSGQLPSRLEQHFLMANKDRSIFRKNVGRCLLHRSGDPYLAIWELDLTTRAAKLQHLNRVDVAKQAGIESQVTDHIRSHLSFVVLPVDVKDERMALEVKLIATVASCGECQPSEQWLGRQSPKVKVRDSGLWQEQGLNGARLTMQELQDLR